MSFRSILFHKQKLMLRPRWLSSIQAPTVVSSTCQLPTASAAVDEELPRYSIPVVVNVHIDASIQKYLKIPRKIRLLISTKPLASYTLETFRRLLTSKFKSLEDKPYRLQHKEEFTDLIAKPIEDDNYLTNLIENAKGKDSALLFLLTGTPGVFPPPEVLKNPLPVDPSDSPSYTMVSFFSFHPIQKPYRVQEELFELWNPMKVLGRVYVAKEGINAQMAIPTNIFPYFQEKTKSLIYFQESRFNTDPAVPKEIFLQQKPFRNLHIRIRSQIVTDGLELEESEEKNHHHESHQSHEEENSSSTERFRMTPTKVSSPSLTATTENLSLDWKHAGNELTPLQWHEALIKEGQNITLLDCRNSYESDVGIFENAVPLNTTFFRESWKALDEVLANLPKDKPVYTYCTGGIRCVKINAYLEQVLGFHNTYRLQGGIIAYRRELEKMKEQITTSNLIHDQNQHQNQKNDMMNITNNPSILNSKFHGINYVFDERIGERITDDILSFCEYCGQDYDSFHNCRECNVRFLQCPSCQKKYDHFCSLNCKAEHQKKIDLQQMKKDQENSKKSLFSMRRQLSTKIGHSMARHHHRRTVNPNEEVISSSQQHLPVNETAPSSSSSGSPQFSHAIHRGETWMELISQYTESMSEKPPLLLQQIQQETETIFPANVSRMLSGANQGAFLSLIATISRAKNILELGSFTGYSTLCLAMPFAEFSQKSSSSLPSWSSRQVYSCDQDERVYSIAKRYIDQSPWKDNIHLVRATAEDFLWQLQEQRLNFDLVFLDADKKEYLNYLQTLMSPNPSKGTPPLLNDQAFVIIDNTLWKGLVLGEDDNLKQFAPSGNEYGANQKRFQNIAKRMHELNKFLVVHPHLRILQLPIRDGLTIIQYLRPNESSPQ